VPRNSGQSVRLGRRYLVDQVAEGRTFGLQVGAWLAQGTGPAIFKARVPAKITLVNDDGALAEA
jgi:hypothetical protein